MPSLRRIYKQGNSIVVSIPAYILRELDVEAGDYFLIHPTGPKTLMMEAVTQPMASAVYQERAANLRVASFRKIFKQGNCGVVTIPNYIRDKIEARKGDYLFLTVISQNSMMGVVKSQEIVAFERNNNYNQYQQGRNPSQRPS